LKIVVIQSTKKIQALRFLGIEVQGRHYIKKVSHFQVTDSPVQYTPQNNFTHEYRLTARICYLDMQLAHSGVPSVHSEFGGFPEGAACQTQTGRNTALRSVLRIA
jgi:hypothetical protein